MGKREGGSNKKAPYINKTRGCSYTNCENGLKESNELIAGVCDKNSKGLHIGSECISGKLRDIISALSADENGRNCMVDNSYEVWCVCRVTKPCAKCNGGVKDPSGATVSPVYVERNLADSDSESEPTTPTPEPNGYWEDFSDGVVPVKGHTGLNGDASNGHNSACVTWSDSTAKVDSSYRDSSASEVNNTGEKKCPRSISEYEKDVNEFSEAAVNDLQDLFARLDALNSGDDGQCEGQCEQDTCRTGSKVVDGSGAATPNMDTASTCSFDHFDFDTSFCSLKSTDMMEQGDLVDQLSLVQQMVVEMKTGFARAMEELSKIQYGDQKLQQQLADNKKECGQEIDTVKQVVDELKTEVKTLCSKMQDITDAQKSLQEKLDIYQTDKEALLEELQRNGAINEQVRLRLGGGSQGVDETALPPDVAPMVHPYLNSLQNHHQRGVDEYQSDSSLMMAVSRSLNLTQALGEKCLNLDGSTSSDDDEVNSRHSQTDSGHKKPTKRHGAFLYEDGARSSQKIPPHQHLMEEVHREEAARDIVEAEREYCSQIWALLEDFMNPLRDEEIMGRRDLNLLFPTYIPHIYEQHCIMLRKLEERLKKWKHNGVVGDVFAKFTDSQDGDGLTVYKDFINDFPNIITAMNRWFSHSPHYRQLMQSQCLANAPVLPLLLAPLQQVPKYSLLLKNLLKYTPVDHPDRYYLESSLTRLKHFLVNMNDDLEHAMQVINDEGQQMTRSRESGNSARSRSSGSSGEVNHASRDSGVHSNEEEKDKPQMSPNTTRRYLLQLLRDKREHDGAKTGIRAPSPRSREKPGFGSHPDLTNQPPGYQDGRMSPYLSSLTPSKKFSSLSKLPMPKEGNNKRSRSHRLQDAQRPQINPNYLRPLTPQVIPSSTSAHSFDTSKRRDEFADRQRARPASAMDFTYSGSKSQDHYLEVMAQQAALAISPSHSTSSDRSRRDLQMSLQKLLAETNNQDGDYSDSEQPDQDIHMSSYHNQFLASKERILRLSQQSPSPGHNSNIQTNQSKERRQNRLDYPQEDFGIYGDDDDDENDHNHYEHENVKPMKLLPDTHRPKIMVPRWRQNASPLPPSYAQSGEFSNRTQNGFTSEENLAASLAQSLLNGNKRHNEQTDKPVGKSETVDTAGASLNKEKGVRRQAKLPESPREHQQGLDFDHNAKDESVNNNLQHRHSLETTHTRPSDLSLNQSNSSTGTNSSYNSNTLPKMSSETATSIPKRHSVERLTDVIAFTADCIENREKPADIIDKNQDTSPRVKSSLSKQVDSPSGKLDISKILSDNNMKVSSVDGTISPGHQSLPVKKSVKELTLSFSTSDNTVVEKTSPSPVNTESLVHYFQNRTQINQSASVSDSGNKSTFMDNKTSTPVHEHKAFGEVKNRDSFNTFVKKESARLTRGDELRSDKSVRTEKRSASQDSRPKGDSESGLRPLDKLRMSFEKQKQLSEERKQAQLQHQTPQSPTYDANSTHKPTIQRQFNEISATVKKTDPTPRVLTLKTFSSSTEDQSADGTSASNSGAHTPESPEPKTNLYKKAGQLKSPAKYPGEMSASARQIQRLERSVSPSGRPMSPSERAQSPNGQPSGQYAYTNQYDKFKSSVLAKPASHRASTGDHSFIPQRSKSPTRSRASLERDRPKSTTELANMTIDRSEDNSQLKSAMTKIPVLRKSSGHISKSSEDISKIKKKPAFKDQLKNIFSRKKRKSKLYNVGYDHSDYDNHFMLAEDSSFQHVDHVDDILTFPLSRDRRALSTSHILQMYRFEDDDDYDDVISPV